MVPRAMLVCTYLNRRAGVGVDEKDCPCGIDMSYYIGKDESLFYMHCLQEQGAEKSSKRHSSRHCPCLLLGKFPEWAKLEYEITWAWM